jgi:uncharacterized LabA/DUF88 family protein
VADEIYRKMAEGLSEAQVGRIVEDTLDEEGVCRLLSAFGLEDTEPSGAVHALVERFRGDLPTGRRVVRTLITANEGLMREVSALATDEIRRQIDDAPEAHRRGQMLFALLADDRPEVNAFAAEIFAGAEQSESEPEPGAAAPRMLDVSQLIEELISELEQTREERSELIKLINTLRADGLGSGVPAGASPSTDEPSPAPVGAATQSPSHPRADGPARVALFVDVQNIFYNARNFYGRKLDFKRLMEVATEGRELASAIAYLVFSPDVDQTSFVTMLQQNGYAVREKTPRPVVRADSGPGHRAAVPGMAPMHADILERIGDANTVVLVGSDGDVPALAREIRAVGATVEFYAFAQNAPEEAIGAADSFHPIDEGLLLNQEYVPRQQQSSAAERDQLEGTSTTRGGEVMPPRRAPKSYGAAQRQPRV